MTRTDYILSHIDYPYVAEVSNYPTYAEACAARRQKAEPEKWEIEPLDWDDEDTFGEAYSATLEALKNKRVRSLSIMDWTDVDCDRSRNGGSYAEGVKFYPDNTANTAENKARYFREEATSGEFCPYCGQWGCCGDCHDPDSVPLEAVIGAIIDGITSRKNGADIRITVHTVYGDCWTV